MLFEQACYTRTADRGWEISASSCSSMDFLNKCKSLGARFETESDYQTANLIYFSEEFGTYVGIGITRTEYPIPGNRIVRMLIPEERAEDPSEYYLDYDILNSGLSQSDCRQVEIDPCLGSSDGSSDYEAILTRYHLNEEKLAELFYKVLPILCGEKNQLAVVISERDFRKEDFPAAARELTWLVSMLVPVEGKEKKDFRRHLSCCVFSQKNAHAANLAFVTSPLGFSNSFVLMQEPSGEIPDICHLLAEKAMASLHQYTAFIHQLETCRLDRKTDTENFTLMVRWWQIRKNRKIFSKNDIPISLETLQRRASGRKYRSFLYDVIWSLGDLTVNDLITLYKSIFRGDKERFDTDGGYTEFLDAYIAATEKAFRYIDKNNKIIFNGYLKIENKTLMSLVFRKLWKNGDGDSCLIRELQKPVTAEQFVEKLTHFQIFFPYPEFLEAVSEIIIENNYYFSLNPENRKIFSTLMTSGDAQGNEVWEQDLDEKITDIFDESPDYLDFLSSETGRLEEKYIPVYFRRFLNRSRNAKTEEERDTIHDVGHAFMDYYRQNGSSYLHENEIAEFERLNLKWYRFDFQDELYKISFRELADLKKFKKYHIEFPEAFYTQWSHEVFNRLQKESITQETCSKLLARRWELAILGEDVPKKMESAITENYCTLQAHRMKEMPLEELASAVYGKIQELPEAHKGLQCQWCREIIRRMQDAESVPNDSIMKKLFFKRKDLPAVDSELWKEYTDTVWNFCGDNMRWRIFGSCVFGVIDYSIWNWMELCNTESYKRLQETLTEFRSMQTEEVLLQTACPSDPDMKAEVNRCSYLLWSKAQKNTAARESIPFPVFPKENMASTEDVLFPFLASIQERLIALNDREAAKDYLKIDILKSELEEKIASVSEYETEFSAEEQAAAEESNESTTSEASDIAEDFDLPDDYNIADIDGISEAEGISDTGNISEAESVSDIENISDAENVSGAENIPDGEGVSDAKKIPYAENIPDADSLADADTDPASDNGSIANSEIGAEEKPLMPEDTMDADDLTQKEMNTAEDPVNKNDSRLSARCGRYLTLKDRHPDFYRTIMELQEEAEPEIFRWLMEIYTYIRLEKAVEDKDDLHVFDFSACGRLMELAYTLQLCDQWLNAGNNPDNHLQTALGEEFAALKEQLKKQVQNSKIDKQKKSLLLCQIHIAEEMRKDRAVLPENTLTVPDRAVEEISAPNKLSGKKVVRFPGATIVQDVEPVTPVSFAPTTSEATVPTTPAPEQNTPLRKGKGVFSFLKRSDSENNCD